MSDDGGISMTIGTGAVGMVLGFALNMAKSKIFGTKGEREAESRMVDAQRCSELHGVNERDHRDLFSRVSILERDLAASRATQESMRVTVDRIDMKLDRMLDRLPPRKPSPQED
jgi:hypothetical protein